MDGKKRKYLTGDYLTEADLTDAEKKRIWNYIYENSSFKEGKHNLKFTKEEYAHCMRHEGQSRPCLRAWTMRKREPSKCATIRRVYGPS